jgi:hypothetical protein
MLFRAIAPQLRPPWRKAFAKSNQPGPFDMMTVLQRVE